MEGIIATREEIINFLTKTQPNYDGDYGYGSGSGEGTGFGTGFGTGSICSISRGYVCSDSYGSGSGSGSGRGENGGDGTGRGHVDCYGYGHDAYSFGDIKAINGYNIDHIDCEPTVITQVKGNYARGYIVRRDLRFTPCFIARVGDSFAHGKTLKEAYKDALNKEIENMPIGDKIKNFTDVFGGLESLHKGREFYEWHHILTGSCTMGRDEFCKAHDVDMDANYTVGYFLDITKNSYGSEIINQLIEVYKHETCKKTSV